MPKLHATLTILVLLGMFALAACGGGGSSTMPGHAHTLQLKTPLASPTPTPGAASLATSVPLQSGIAIEIPSVEGIVGSFTQIVSSPPPAVSVLLTSYATEPVGAPADQGMSAPTPVFWISSVYSASLNMQGFPSQLTYTLPPGFTTSGDGGRPSGFGLEKFDGTTGVSLGYEDNVPLRGSSVAVTDSSALSVVAGHTYWWKLFCHGTNFTSMPLTSAGVTTKLMSVCGFDNTFVTEPSNDAPGNVSLGYEYNVPPCCVGPSPPPGTTTGLMAVRMENTDGLLFSRVDFNSGALQFDAQIPSVISTVGKTFIATGCAFNIHFFGSGYGENTKSGCLDTPYVSGPLPVAGQTISFSGVPFPISLAPQSGTDCASLTDCNMPGYVVVVYY